MSFSFFVTEILPDGQGAWGIEVDEDGRPSGSGRTKLQGRVHSLGWIDGAEDAPPLPPLPPPNPDRPLYAQDWHTLLAISQAVRSSVILTAIDIKRDVELMLKAFNIAPNSSPPAPEPIQGGRILECKPGVWRWGCTEIDVKAMYPSVMVELGERPEASPKERLLGLMMLHLKQQRQRLPDLKILMNSVYGILASPGSSFYDPSLANKITARGRGLITFLETAIEKAGGCVLYGHTDSVCYALPPGRRRLNHTTSSRHFELTTKHYDGCIVFNKTTHWLWSGEAGAEELIFKGPLSTEPKTLQDAAWRYLCDGIEGGGEARLPERLKEDIDAVLDAPAPIFWGAVHGLIEGFDPKFEERSSEIRERD